MTPFSHSLAVASAKSVWSTVMCEPRWAGLRGLTISAPSGTRSSSESAIAYSVSLIDFSRTASIPTVAISSTMSLRGCMASTGGVPVMNLRMPCAGLYDSVIPNGLSAPIQPQMGCCKRSCCEALT
ncbi:hypothetical protein D3C73_1372020 [compost metagenome]